MIREERLDEDLEHLNLTEAWLSVVEEVETGSHENYTDMANAVGDSGPRGESNTRRKASFLESQGIIYKEGGIYKVRSDYILPKKTQKL